MLIGSKKLGIGEVERRAQDDKGDDDGVTPQKRDESFRGKGGRCSLHVAFSFLPHIFAYR